MGPAQSSLLGLGATVGVAASKMSQAISEANDAMKARAAKKRALENMKQAQEDKQTLKKEAEETVKKIMNRANLNDPKALADLRELGGM
jgi:hypothetical protein